MITGIERHGFGVRHQVSVDSETECVGVFDVAAAVVDDGLEQREARCDVVIGDGAGGLLGEGQGDAAIGCAVASPTAGLVTGKAVFGNGVGADVDRIDRIVLHQGAVDSQSESVGVGDVAAVVVDDGLDHLDSRGYVVVGDGAGRRLPQGQRDGVAIVLGAADANPVAGGIAGRAAALGQVIRACLESRGVGDTGARTAES